MRWWVMLLALTSTTLPARARPQLLEPPARLGPARPADAAENAVRPASFSVPQDQPRIVPDDLAERPLQQHVPATTLPHPATEFLEARSRLAAERSLPRTSDKFGDGLADLFDPQQPKEWLFSDHGFDCMVTPISNPFLAEDPRALTEIRPIFIYQKVPGQQPNFQGGDIWFFGTRASIAFTERFSITLNKLGGINVNPGNPAIDSDFGFAELWLGPKYAFWRDPQNGTIAAGGLIFQIPTGSNNTLQNTGNLSLTPYVSVGKTLSEIRQGTFNGIAVMGYNFATDDKRSDYLYLTGHLDFDVGDHHRFYPVAELNYFQFTKGGERFFSGQGHDLINTGAERSASASLVTGAIGARYKITEAAQIGGAFELPLIGNRDLFQYRFTLDVIFRY